jgi:3-oxoadipate enol-lactonase
MPFLDVGDASLFYEVRGSDDPPVVLVHGAMCSHVDWKYQLGDLARRFTVLAPDLRAHGSSRSAVTSCTIQRFASDIHSVLDSVVARRAILVGHSLGARVVIEAAAQRPDRVAGLVLVDCSRMFGPAPIAATEHASQLTNRQLRELKGRTIEDAIGPFADVATRAHVTSTMRPASIGLTRALLAAWQDWDVNRYDGALESVSVGLPVLAIQSTHVERGARRRCLTAGTLTTPYLEYLTQHVPSVTTVTLAEVGHFSMLEVPDEVSRLIRTFASSVVPSGDGVSPTN